MEREQETGEGFGQRVAAGSGSSRGDRLLAIAALVVGLGAGILGGAYLAGPLLAKRLGASAEVLLAESERVGPRSVPRPIHQLENLVVNPAQTQGMRFLVVTVAFEAHDETTVRELERRDVEVRDVVLRLLAAKTITELTSMATRDTLKRELLEIMADRFGPGRVHEIYFPQFVIQ